MKSILIGLSPNLEKDDVITAFLQIINPLLWNKSLGIDSLEKWFSNFFNVSYAVTFDNARSALYVILHSLDLKKEDEVILQAFTCVVVPNAVIAIGAKPVYVDIDNALTIDINDLEKKITKKTKAIIIQHTFGIPANMDLLQKIAIKYNLFLIEDAAHTIGGTYKEKKLGTLSDAAIFSFGRDKAFSSVFGGVAITNNKKLGEKIKFYQNKLSFPNKKWVLQQLFHPIITWFILIFYNSIFSGKVLLIILQKLRLLSFPVLFKEKQGEFPIKEVYKMPNPLANLALNQLSKLDKFNQKREGIVKKYNSILGKINNIKVPNYALLRYPLFVSDPIKTYLLFKKKYIYLGNWYHNTIDPDGTNLFNISYLKGSCPNAEYFAKHIINLPTNPNMNEDDIKRIISSIKELIL